MDDAKTIGQLMERYALQVIPEKKITTQTHNKTTLKPIQAAFGAMGLLDIKPRHIYQFIDRSEAKTAARRQMEVLSHALTKAVEWGLIDRHPFKGEVRLKGEKARTRYVEDWEILECLSLDSKRKVGSILAVQAYIRIALLTGMRRGDLLRLTVADLKENGVHVTPRKTQDSTGKSLIIEWSDELRSAIGSALEARPVKLTPYIFCNRNGECYFDERSGRAGGWESLWRGFTERVMKETGVVEKFTEHDLRAKCASDASSLEHARILLSHANVHITERVYRRKPELVRPVR
ncbi:integrase [Janthinobacterium sp. 1_2014MBL_MicDiv]|nr:integrase [Janthinobacterium sp. 1_2014MBL_MicDiv]